MPFEPIARLLQFFLVSFAFVAGDNLARPCTSRGSSGSCTSSRIFRIRIRIRICIIIMNIISRAVVVAVAAVVAVAVGVVSQLGC